MANLICIIPTMKKVIELTIIAILTLVISSWVLYDFSGGELSEIQDIVADLDSYELVTPEPIYMMSKVALLCRMPTPEDIAEEASNVHIDKYISVYVNNTGSKAMRTPEMHEQVIPHWTDLLK
jgi:hypothetical protein